MCSAHPPPPSQECALRQQCRLQVRAWKSCQLQAVYGPHSSRWGLKSSFKGDLGVASPYPSHEILGLQHHKWPSSGLPVLHLLLFTICYRFTSLPPLQGLCTCCPPGLFLCCSPAASSFYSCLPPSSLLPIVLFHFPYEFKENYLNWFLFACVLLTRM